VNERDQVLENDLGDVIAEMPIRDCRLEFRQQRATGDLWCIVSGPLAVIAREVIPADILARVRTQRDPTDPLARRARGRYAKWQHARIDDDLLIAMRARGNHLEWHHTFGDGTPFGGGGGWLPSARRESLLERARLAGYRGRDVEVAVHTDEVAD
jgi:hypothetical protein